MPTVQMNVLLSYDDGVLFNSNCIPSIEYLYWAIGNKNSININIEPNS